MKKLRMEDLEARMTEHAKESVTSAFGIMKGVTLAAAGVSVFAIMNQVLGGDLSALLKLPIWAASVWLAWLTFNNMTVFSNLLSYEMEGFDTAILFVKTIIEFLLFAVLANGKSWYSWPILHGLLAGLAFIKVRRYLTNLKDERYEATLRPLVAWIRSWSGQRDVPGLFGTSLFFLISGSSIVVLYLRGAMLPETANLLTYAVCVVSFVPLWIATKSGETIRRQIIKTVDSLPERGSASLALTEGVVQFEPSSLLASSGAVPQMNVVEQQRRATAVSNPSPDLVGRVGFPKENNVSLHKPEN